MSKKLLLEFPLAQIYNPRECLALKAHGAQTRADVGKILPEACGRVEIFCKTACGLTFTGVKKPVITFAAEQ